MVSNKVTTFCGSGGLGYMDGKSIDALFGVPVGLVVCNDGNVLVMDRSNNGRIRNISPDGIVSTLTGHSQGQNQEEIVVDGKHIALSCNGDIIVPERNRHRICLVARTGKMSVLAGTGVEGHCDGYVESARFKHPSGVVVDHDGNIFVSEYFDDRIRKITPDGIVSRFAGSGLSGFADGQGTEAHFYGPAALAIDSKGNLFVSDVENHSIRRISPSGEVTKLAGNGSPGNATGNGNSACLAYPAGLTVDGDDNVIVADQNNHRIVKIESDGTVSVLAGSGTRGFKNGLKSRAQFSYPTDVAIDNRGNVLVSDAGNKRIRAIDVGLTPPTRKASDYEGESSKPLVVNIAAVLSKHMSASKYSDVEIHVEERVFPAHRLILSRCAFFEAAFENDCVENSDGKIVMNDMNADAFQLVLEYLYTEKVNIPVECDALALRSAAAFLGLPDLQQKCESEIQKRLCVDNLAKCYRYAKVNSMNHLKRRCVAVATESMSALASVQLTKEYVELVESDEALKQDFLEEIRSSGR